jgi:hypothetical protein
MPSSHFNPIWSRAETHGWTEPLMLFLAATPGLVMPCQQAPVEGLKLLAVSERNAGTKLTAGSGKGCASSNGSSQLRPVLDANDGDASHSVERVEVVILGHHRQSL